MNTTVATVQFTSVPFETKHKRFCVPGAVIRSTCPECGKVCEKNLEADYLSCPMANEPIEVTFYHESDGGNGAHEWASRIILRITVESVP